MDRRDDIDSLTLARYLSGELAPTEAAEVERWIAADPAHRELLDSLRKVWSPRELPDFDPDDVLWRRIAAGLERPLPKPALVQLGQTRAWPFRAPSWLLTAAAAAAVLVVGGAVLLAKLRQPAAPVPMREVATRLGQRAALDLPDGSRVVHAAFPLGAALFWILRSKLRPDHVPPASQPPGPSLPPPQSP